MQELIDGNRRVVAMGHRPDNVPGPERRVPAEEHLGNGRLEGGFVQPTISGCRSRHSFLGVSAKRRMLKLGFEVDSVYAAYASP